MRTFLLAPVLVLLAGCGPADTRTVPGTSAPGQSEGASVVRAQPAIAGGYCQYDNTASLLGIGLVIAPAEFAIFNDVALQDAFATVDLYADDEGHQGICPKFFGPEYGIMHFVCLDSTANAYKILTDYSSVKYLGRTSGSEFKSWTNYIMESFGIRRVRQEGGARDVPPPIRREPSESSASLLIPEGHEMFCPIEVRGEWVKVKYDCFYNREENPHEGEPCHDFIGECAEPLTGWVRWRKENRLLIEIFLMP